jgi:hypothetical protein
MEPRAELTDDETSVTVANDLAVRRALGSPDRPKKDHISD